MSDFDVIVEVAEANGGIFRTKDIVDAGLRKERLKEYLLAGEICKIKRGYYKLSGTSYSLLYEVQKECPRGIYSFGTAAHLWGLVSSRPNELDLTVVRGHNTSKLMLGAKIKYHYVIDNLYEVGITEIKTDRGERLKVYDKERTICDFVRHRNKINRSLYSEVLNTYFKNRNMDVMKLVKYGRLFHISEELEMYMDVL